MNILFVHPLIGNAYELYKAFQRNKNINIIPLLDKKEITKNSLYERIRYKFKIPVDKYRINRKFLDYDLSDIDIVFVVKCNELYPNTLKKLKNKYKNLILVNWSQDDMYAKHNRSIYYTLSLKLYDFVITQKSYNCNELMSLGARKVLFQNKAYSKDIHKPEKCSDKYNHDIIFIGFPEKERLESIVYLVNNSQKVHVYGYPDTWKKLNLNQDNIVLHEESLYGKDYAEALSCAKISLCFLRKINRDLQTSRSIEIPACKGFMLAERTQEHLDLFEEDKEAVYFDNNEELLKKVTYYLKHEKERRQIAENGYKRCITSGYSYDDRVVQILKEVEKL